ncbi:MAG: type II toxin-antitoxin system VapB family antitoxin [Rubrivivax sp.]
MRTNIVIDEALMAEAMKAGPYKTKKEAVEAGLKLLARQAAYREILKWEGKLHWEGDDEVDWTQPPGTAHEASRVPALEVRAPVPPAYANKPAKPAKPAKSRARR